MRNKKYRIVEETRNLTGKKTFYIQKCKKRWFSKKYYWKNVMIQHYESDTIMLLTFDTLEEAQKWLNYKIETVTNVYHY